MVTAPSVSNCNDHACHHKSASYYTDTVLLSLHQLSDLIHKRKKATLDGQSLDLSSVVAVACHSVSATITEDPEVLDQMQHSVNVLNEKLAQGEVIYGVNTGFGGSADTRTEKYDDLQKALIQHHHSAVLLPSDRGLAGVSPLDGLRSHSIPIPMVKAAMLTRCNSLLRGHSAVRIQVVQHILTLLENDMTPVVPLRGSISASGDLTPLAYIAGVVEGNSDISVHWIKNGESLTIPADVALKEIGLAPLDLGPKEGLGLLNGTAFSCGAASLVLWEANQLTLLSQVLTAMGTEALLGTRNNYHPFIADVRPHSGQREAAATIFSFLHGSKLATGAHPGHQGLAQDRYALRTSTQWIGPQIENMALAIKQVQCELNSTTDNPLLDPVEETMHHGGNFQAASVTSAMEKTMTAMQMLGKMIFSQCSEIINPMLSNGLPPNLSPDDPSLSFAFKGIDINMASYMSELAYLNHPVSNYVQSAEMHNQGLNSLAFIASRYTMEAVEVLSLMTATYLYVLCQALDLRALHLEFAKEVKKEINDITVKLCGTLVGDRLPAVKEFIWRDLMSHWARASTSDLPERSDEAAMRSMGVLIDFLDVDDNTSIDTGKLVRSWRNRVSDALQQNYATTRTSFFSQPTTKQYLCSTSEKFYGFVREELAVPMHKGLVDHPTYGAGDGKSKECIGSQVGKVYTALRKGAFGNVLINCWLN